MIEVKINITSFAQLAAVGAALATIDGVKLTAAPAPAGSVTPQMQEAARQSVAEGTAAGATGTKPAKAQKGETGKSGAGAASAAPAAGSAPASPSAQPSTSASSTGPSSTAADAIVASSTTTLPTYAESGLSELIAKAQLKDKDATIAAIRGAGGVNEEGKTKGSSVPPANFADLAALLGKIIGGGDTALD